MDCKSHSPEGSHYHGPVLSPLEWDPVCLPIPLPEEHFPDYLAPLYSAQEKLGWDQLLYGQISMSWVHYIMNAGNGTINGTIFYSRIIQTILKFFLDTWTAQNKDLHNIENPQEHTALQPQAQNLLHTMQEDPILQLLSNHIPHKTIIMTCSTWQLCTLAHHCAQQSQVHFKGCSLSVTDTQYLYIFSEMQSLWLSKLQTPITGALDISLCGSLHVTNRWHWVITH